MTGNIFSEHTSESNHLRPLFTSPAHKRVLFMEAHDHAKTTLLLANICWLGSQVTSGGMYRFQFIGGCNQHHSSAGRELWRRSLSIHVDGCCAPHRSVPRIAIQINTINRLFSMELSFGVTLRSSTARRQLMCVRHVFQIRSIGGARHGGRPLTKAKRCYLHIKLQHANLYFYTLLKIGW